MRPSFILLTVCLAGSLSNVAGANQPGYFDLTTDANLETGDTWMSAGKRYRLYGFQSCLRGTSYTDRAGNKQDCGEASMAVLAAFVRDTKPVCAAVVEQSDLTYAVCYATVGGQRLDLAMMLVTEGYGFASLDRQGVPVYPPYAVAEQRAREGRNGLWQFSDVQHPSILLGQAARNSGVEK